MDKKKIISTTIMFVLIVTTIIVFKSIFGDENALVAVAGITAALSLLNTDYTINPIKNTIFFVFLEVGLGIAAYLASINAMLGLVITFVAIFTVLYLFTYNTKKPTYIAFSLGYFFMLYSPVSIEYLPKRLLGLAFCGLAIMGMQMLANRNKLKKEAKNNIKSSIENIRKEITLIINQNECSKIEDTNTHTYDNLKKLMESIYRRIDNNIKLPILLIQYLFISQYLDSINLTLQKIKKYKNDYECHLILNEVEKTLSSINKFLNEEISVESLREELEKILNVIKGVKAKHYLICELHQHISVLNEDLKYKEEDYIEKINESYISSNVIYILTNLKNSINRDSVKFTFAFRSALVTSIGVFVVSAFNLEYGKWLVFSLTAIVQPYYESSKTKSKDRIIGTIMGLIIFEILFSIITDNSGRSLIILAVGYISNYLTQYRYQLICTTISSLGVASIGVNINYVSFERMIFVFIGTLVALFANKIILPCKISNVMKREIQESIQLNEKILEKLYNIGTKKLRIDNEFKEIVTTNEFLNGKISNNNETLLLSNIDEFLYNQRIFMHEIRSLINNFKEYKKSYNDELKLLYDIDLILNRETNENNILMCFNSTEDINVRLILINVIEIKQNIVKSKKIYEETVNVI